MANHRFEFAHVGRDDGGTPVALEINALGIDDHWLAGCARQCHHVGGAAQRAFGIVRQNDRVDQWQLRFVCLQKLVGVPLRKMILKVKPYELLLARNNAQLGDGFAAHHFLQMRVYVSLGQQLLHLCGGGVVADQAHQAGLHAKRRCVGSHIAGPAEPHFLFVDMNHRYRCFR